MERDKGSIDPSMESKAIPRPSYRQLVPELQVVGLVEGILDLNDSRGKNDSKSKNEGSCIDQEKSKTCHQENLLHIGTGPQDIP
jgi:hypothetical protein